jgi:hypothetical protein
MARRAARRDEKPRPGNCRAGNVAADRIEIRLRAKVAAALEAEGASQRPDLDPVVVSIEAKLRRAGKGKRLVIENGAEAEVNAGLAARITRSIRDPETAFVWIGRQHRGNDRTPRNGPVTANPPSARAAAASRARRDALVGWRGLLSRSGFDWVKPPVLNP